MSCDIDAEIPVHRLGGVDRSGRQDDHSVALIRGQNVITHWTHVCRTQIAWSELPYAQQRRLGLHDGACYRFEDLGCNKAGITYPASSRSQ